MPRKKKRAGTSASVPVVAVIHLGCAKNQVDSERLLGAVSEAGFIPSSDVESSDAVVVTTCAFVEPAVEETSDLIDGLSELRNSGGPRLIVAGCMVNRFGIKDLMKRFPAVDAFIDLGSYEQLPKVVKRLLGRKKTKAKVPVSGYVTEAFELRPRLLSTQGYAYLKISEGCSNRCNYCTIPDIRGPLRHRPMAALIDEARELAELGAAELVLIAQDTAAYRDPGSGEGLGGLIARLAEIDGIEWMRLMYAHPAHIDDNLIRAFGEVDKLLPYLDMPIQHASDKVLSAMGRGYTSEDLRRVIDSLRNARPDIALRTTVMVGHPGEDEEAFDGLLKFLSEVRFANLGTFVYSPEEGTVSAEKEPGCSMDEMEGRLDAVMSLQQRITFDFLDGYAGKVVDVLVENGDAARTVFQAPEVDGVVLSDHSWAERARLPVEKDRNAGLRARLPVENARPNPVGRISRALITRREGYDLKGEPL